MIERYFPGLPQAQRAYFIAGLSMGGYGALRLALRYPGRYAAAASISGCVEMERGYETFRRQNPSVSEELDNVYGGERELLRGPVAACSAWQTVSSRNRNARPACI